MVIGMDGFFRTHHPAQHLNGPVGDHLIGIHVRLRARTRLPDNQREMIIELALDHLIGRLHDGFGNGRVQPPQSRISLRRRPLHNAKCPHHGDGLAFPTDLEIPPRALRLRPPITGGIHLNGAESIGFSAGLGHRAGSVLRNLTGGLAWAAECLQINGSCAIRAELRLAKWHAILRPS